jgi:predicted nuclease of predicted toxin-antitoxin system
VRVLLDENLPHDLASELVRHDVATVHGVGWAGIKNGELLRQAADKIDAFLTMDRNLEHQQNLSGLSFGIVVIRARSNRVEDLRPLVSAILAALGHIEPGKVQHVGA